jgi:hypothetical protein
MLEGSVDGDYQVEILYGLIYDIRHSISFTFHP